MRVAAPLALGVGDLLVTNHSFENGLTGWTQRYGTGGITTDASQHLTGTYSCKITDTSTTEAFGTESGYLPATAGTYYSAQARVYIASGTATIAVRFWNSSYVATGSSYVSKTTPTATWTYITSLAQAPANTAYVTVMIYSSSTATCTTYWDDAQVTALYTDLGVQVTNASMHSGAFGLGAYQNTAYVLMDGSEGDTDAKMSIVNVDTEAVSASYTLAGATGGWGACTATDGNIYFGTYYGATLYRYTPGQTSVVSLGAPPSPSNQNHILCLTPGLSGKVYGGTYPSAGFFRYYNGAFLQIGSAPIWSGEDYVRGIDYDEATDISYLGCGSASAALISYNHSSGTKTNILPSQFAGEEFVYGVNVVGNRVFAHTLPSNHLVVMNKTNNQMVYTRQGGIAGLGTTPTALNNKVYYCAGEAGGPLMAYNLTTDTEAAVGYSPGFYPLLIGYVTLADQTNFPGQSVVGIGNYNGKTYMFKYNPTTGMTRKVTLAVAETPVTLNNIGAGPDQKIYSSGYLTGGTGVYTPCRSDLYTQYDGVMQTYGMQPYNGKMFFAVYPNAQLYEYDPSSPWVNGVNPIKRFDEVAEEQSRPVAITSGGGKIFIGTIAGYGLLDGALTIYDPATQTKTVKVGLINDQGISSLVYYNGKVYGGSTVAGGLGSTPTQTNAKFFIYDPATDTTTIKSLPTVAGRTRLTSITALALCNGRIWGFAEGCLFKYNPNDNTFMNIWDKYPSVNYGTGGAWYDAALQFTQDGMLYGTIAQTYLFRVDLANGNIIQQLNTGAEHIAEDGYGNIYYSKGTRLWRLAR